MANGHNFEHLPLLLRYEGIAKLKGGGSSAPQTVANRGARRQEHSQALVASAGGFTQQWQQRKAQRAEAALPVIPQGVPLLLQVDPSLDLDVLRDRFAFEIVAEQEEGYVIVASEDIELTSFVALVNSFAVAVHLARRPLRRFTVCLTIQDRRIVSVACCRSDSTRSGRLLATRRSMSSISAWHASALRRFRTAPRRASATRTPLGPKRKPRGRRRESKRTTLGTRSRRAGKATSNSSSRRTPDRSCISSTAHRLTPLFCPTASRFAFGSSARASRTSFLTTRTYLKS